jgi:hypothetical protein
VENEPRIPVPSLDRRAQNSLRAISFLSRPISEGSPADRHSFSGIRSKHQILFPSSSVLNQNQPDWEGRCDNRLIQSGQQHGGEHPDNDAATCRFFERLLSCCGFHHLVSSTTPDCIGNFGAWIAPREFWLIRGLGTGFGSLGFLLLLQVAATMRKNVVKSGDERHRRLLLPKAHSENPLMLSRSRHDSRSLLPGKDKW